MLDWYVATTLHDPTLTTLPPQTSVLTSNGYLRLDPNILHFSTYAAGMFLARHGKPEVKTCIKGLEQYSFAYEEAFEQAKWMQQVYASSIVAPTHVPQSLLSSSSRSNGINAPLSAGEPPDSPLMLYMAHTNGSSVNQVCLPSILYPTQHPPCLGITIRRIPFSSRTSAFLYTGIQPMKAIVMILVHPALLE